MNSETAAATFLTEACPDAAVRCMRLALEYRNTFKQDVFIDLMGYRRYGHNEGDEPAFTQPTLYQNINQHPRVAEQYEQHLTRSNVLGRSDITKIRDACNERYEQALSVSKIFVQRMEKII